MSRRLASICASIAVSATLALGSLASQVAHAEQDKITNPRIGKPLGAAQEAIKAKRWEEAERKLAEANAVEKKTPFEQSKIDEFLSYVLLQQRKYGEASRVYESRLNSGRVGPGEVQSLLLALLQLNYQTKNYPKAVEFGDRWVKGGGSAPEQVVLVAQAHYLQKDYKGTIPLIQSAIQSVIKAGKAPDENWLIIQRSAYQSLADAAGVAKTMDLLVRYYPKPDYWDMLLDRLLRRRNSDPVQTNLFRLMRQVGVLKKPEEYMELTQLLMESGLPGEAQRVMQAGYQAGVFTTTDKARADKYTRLANAAKNSADADRKNLAAAEQEAQKSGTGQAQVALGLAYASVEQYDKAAGALAKGLQLGGLKDPDQAALSLGIVNLKLGKKSDALKAFEQVKADPNMAEVARLWGLYARSVG
jgi:tetratricopeptide (TPR) repeat protein